MRSWARQRLVAASSRRTDENVASRSGSGRHCRRASRARALSLSLKEVSSRLQGLRPGILPEKAAHDVLEKTGSLLLYKLRDHITEDSANSVESFVCGTDVVQSMVIQ